MKLTEVEIAISEDYGYLVHFERCGDGFLKSDYFPDVKDGEEPFKTKVDAEKVGADYAKATEGKTCNFYLVRSDSFRPIGGWSLANR
jgi:hypothetical protein